MGESVTRKYTAITLRKEIVDKLKHVERGLGARSLGVSIEILSNYWMERGLRELSKELLELREKDVFKEIRKTIKELRELK